MTDPDGAGDGRRAPAEEYALRLDRLERRQRAAGRPDRFLGYGKLVTGAAILILAAALLRRPAALVFLFIPIAIFVALAVLHERLLRGIRLRARAINFYRRGLQRLNDRWQGTGETGERFLDPQHPYARDLDLFGKASLFELLCTARTRAGEEVLAMWLLAAAAPDEVIARQAAVAELSSKIDFRERLFSVGEGARPCARPQALLDWGQRQPIFTSKIPVVAAIALALLWLFGFVCWAVWDLGEALLLISLLNLAVYYLWRGRVKAATEAAEKASEDLGLLADTFSLLERGPASCPKLTEMQARLRSGGVASSMAIRKLDRILRALAQQQNMFCRAFDYFTFWSLYAVYLAERWQRKFGSAVGPWIGAAGEFEALAALSAFAYEQPQCVFPEYVAELALDVNSRSDSAPLFEAEALAHPLLPATAAISNDVKLSGESRLMILSGPNMAGKSTFIRAVGVNAVLAQCGAPVRARRLRLSPLNVAASICVLDSLAGGVSRFYAEIHRIKLIAAMAEGETPVLFLLDELLSGTNSRDRLAGTLLVVRSLLSRRAVGIVSTHDLALTRIPEAIGQSGFNCHFEDRLQDGELSFDYKLRPGPVETSNALELMKSIGLEATP